MDLVSTQYSKSTYLDVRGRLLAYEEYVHSREIKLIIEWECGKTIVCRVHASIELYLIRQNHIIFSHCFDIHAP